MVTSVFKSEQKQLEQFRPQGNVWHIQYVIVAISSTNFIKKYLILRESISSKLSVLCLMKIFSCHYLSSKFHSISTNKICHNLLSKSIMLYVEYKHMYFFMCHYLSSKYYKPENSSFLYNCPTSKASVLYTIKVFNCVPLQINEVFKYTVR
jgi:hypothetical protein